MTKAVRSCADCSFYSCSYFNKQHLSLHELYLELLKAPSSMFCTIIHLVSSNSKQDSSNLNLVIIRSVHGVNPHLGIKHLKKWQSVRLVLRVQTFDCLITKNKTTFTRSWCKPSLGNKNPTTISLIQYMNRSNISSLTILDKILVNKSLRFFFESSFAIQHVPAATASRFLW